MPPTSVSQFARVAREARRLPAFGDELVERGVERDDDVRRRRVAPLRRLLHVRPLVVEVERRATSSCPPPARARCGARTTKPMPGGPSMHLPDAAISGVERRSSRASMPIAPNELIASTIRLPAVARDDGGDRRQRVEDPGRRLAVDQAHVGDRGVGGEQPVDVLRRGRRRPRRSRRSTAAGPSCRTSFAIRVP